MFDATMFYLLTYSLLKNKKGLKDDLTVIGNPIDKIILSCISLVWIHYNKWYPKILYLSLRGSVFKV